MSLSVNEIQEHNRKLVRDISQYTKRGDAGISKQDALYLQYKLVDLLHDLVMTNL